MQAAPAPRLLCPCVCKVIAEGVCRHDWGMSEDVCVGGLMGRAINMHPCMPCSAALNAIPLQIYGWGLEDFSIMNKIQVL